VLFTPDSVKTEFGDSEIFIGMGGIDNILDLRVDHGERPQRGRRAVIIGCALGLSVALATLAQAGSIRPATIEVPDRPVSTSPATRSQPDMIPSPPEALPTRETRPLTRAAAKQHSEAISPVEWLSRYGRVQVERLR
jgi:hypothetical protein